MDCHGCPALDHWQAVRGVNIHALVPGTNEDGIVRNRRRTGKNRADLGQPDELTSVLNPLAVPLDDSVKTISTVAETPVTGAPVPALATKDR